LEQTALQTPAEQKRIARVLLLTKGISEFVSSRISPKNEIPCATIESQVAEKVRREFHGKQLKVQRVGAREILSTIVQVRGQM
jgi:hypothetical protein